MKAKLILEYFEPGHVTENLSLMLTKSSGENFQILTFTEKSSVQTIEDVFVGTMTPNDTILCSIIGIRCILNLDYNEVMMPSKSHVFNISNPKINNKIYATITLTFEPTLDEKFEKTLQFIEDYSIPWFLKSSDVYINIKQSLICAQESNNKGFVIINQFINYIEIYTVTLLKAVKPMLTEADVKSLIAHIDELLLKYLTVFDSFVESSKVNIAHLLRAFKNAVIEHSKKFKIVLDAQIENGKGIVAVVNKSISHSGRINPSLLSPSVVLKLSSPIVHSLVIYIDFIKGFLFKKCHDTYDYSVASADYVKQNVNALTSGVKLPFIRHNEHANNKFSTLSPYVAHAVELCDK